MLKLRREEKNIIQVFKEKEKKTDKRIPDYLVKKAKEIKGFSFQDISIHFNSDKPSKLNANAYAVKNDIYLSQGKEYLLEHELGHIVQQRNKNLQSNFMMNQTRIHHDQEVEQEANHLFMNTSVVSPKPISNVIQGDFKLVLGNDYCISTFELGSIRIQGPLNAGDHIIANILIYRYQEQMLLNKHILFAIQFYKQFTNELNSEASISQWFKGDKKIYFDQKVKEFNNIVQILEGIMNTANLSDVRFTLMELIRTFNILYVLSPSATYGKASGGKGEAGSRNILNNLINSDLSISLDIIPYTRLIDLDPIQGMNDTSCFTPSVFRLQQEMIKTNLSPSLSGIPSEYNPMLKDLPLTKNTSSETTEHLGILNKYPSIPLPAARMLVMISQLRKTQVPAVNYNPKDIGFTFEDNYLMARDHYVSRAEYEPGSGFGGKLEQDLLATLPFNYTIPALLSHPVKSFRMKIIKDTNLLAIMSDLASQIATKEIKRPKEDFSKTLISFAKTLWIMDGRLISEGKMLKDLVSAGICNINDNRDGYWRPIYNFFSFHLIGTGVKIKPFQ